MYCNLKNKPFSFFTSYVQLEILAHIYWSYTGEKVHHYFPLTHVPCSNDPWLIFPLHGGSLYIHFTKVSYTNVPCTHVPCSLVPRYSPNTFIVHSFYLQVCLQRTAFVKFVITVPKYEQTKSRKLSRNFMQNSRDCLMKTKVYQSKTLFKGWGRPS